MRERYTFLGHAVSEGLRWTRSVLHDIVLLLGLVLFTVGVTVGGILLHRPGWFLGVFGGLVVLLVLGEGAFRVWRTADEQLVARGEDEGPGEPISDDHRKDLQAIAAHLLGGVKRTEMASFLADGDERVNLAIAFTEHFSEVSQRVIDWGRLIEARDAARQELGDWIEQRLSETGLSGSAFATIVAREAEVPKPHFAVDGGEVQVGSGNRLTLGIGHLQDAAEKEPALRELFERVGAQPACSRIATVRAEIRSVQTDLAENLELIRDKTVLRGRCKLCE